MVLVAYAGPESPAAALRKRCRWALEPSVLCCAYRPTFIRCSSNEHPSLLPARRRHKHERRSCFISPKNMFSTDSRPARRLAASLSPLPKEDLHILAEISE
jgi:hypothetical protein